MRFLSLGTNTSQQVPQSSAPRKLSFAEIHQRALEQSAPPSVIVDANADILHMSESAARFLRHVGGELSRNLLTLILPELRLKIRNIARLLPYRSSEDHIDGTVLTFIDITKRRAAEEELRLGEERMRLVAESTRDYAIITLDEQGLITTWNKGAELIFGYSKAEAEGAYYDFIFSPEDRASDNWPKRATPITSRMSSSRSCPTNSSIR